jgi:hypothetical protein
MCKRTFLIAVFLLLVFIETGCKNEDKTSDECVPSVPSPSNGATGISLSTTLSWKCGVDDVYYEDVSFSIYFGTSPGSMTLRANTNNPYINVSGLSPSTTYYWYIYSSNGKKSPTWSFTTN